MIAIYEDTGGDYNQDDYEPTAVYENGEWIADAGGWKDRYPEGMAEEDIAQHLDGPNPVVIEVTDDADELIAKVRQRESDGE